MGSGCTETPLCTYLEEQQGVQGAFVLHSSSAAHLEPSQTTSLQIRAQCVELGCFDCTEPLLFLCSRTLQEAVYLFNGAVSEKSTRLFWLLLPVGCIIWFSEWKNALEVRCSADTQTDTPNYRNPRCACAPRVNNALLPCLPIVSLYMQMLAEIMCEKHRQNAN